MQLLADFFPILLFFLAYKIYGLYVATGVAIIASVVQVSYHWLRGHPLTPTHLITLGLLLVFGGLTLILQDRAFIMWKPSIVNWLFALAFFASHFIGDKTLIERTMGHALVLPAHIWRRLNGLWVLFFTLMGSANLYMAERFFVAEAALREAAGSIVIDFAQCAQQFQEPLINQCLNAQALENAWVNFKLFGLLGLTLLFVLAQGVYLSRYLPATHPVPPAET